MVTRGDVPTERALRPLAFESRPFGALVSDPDLIDSRRKVGRLVHGALICQRPLASGKEI
jgi:hypothetical protein